MAGKFRLKPLKQSEAEIEIAILDYLNIVRKLFAIKIPTTGYFHPTRKRFVKQANPYAINGVGDVFLCFMGLAVFFEIKSEKGRQSPSQMEFERRLRKAGGYYFLVRSVEDVITALDSLEILPDIIPMEDFDE